MTDVKISYTNRSYQQIKEYVLTRLFGLRDTNGQFLQRQGFVPEVTDHTESSLLVRIISVWAGMIETLNYYIDTAAREAFLATCTRYRSGVLIARFYDYRVKPRNAASVDVTFYIPTPQTVAVTIPAFTVVSTEDGTRFYTTRAAMIPIGQTRISAPAKQATNVGFTQLAVSSGRANQKYELPPNLAYNSLSVKVNGLAYTAKDTFAFSSAADRHFIETVNENGTPIVKFGDGYFGVIPATGATIETAYQTTYGASGNVAPLQISQIISTLTLPTGVVVTCANLNGASGGSEVESLAELKRRVPLSNKTRLSAVTKQDYIDLSQTHPSVQRAGVKAQCGADIELYIVPSGGGIASSQTLSDVAAYMEDKKIVGRALTVLPTGQVRIKLDIGLRVRSDYDTPSVYAAVSTRLAAYGSYLNQQIGGTVELNDVIAEVENTEGVVVSKVRSMTTVPFARPLGIWQTLDWTPVTQAASNNTVYWKMSFIAVDRFQLSKDGNYMGTFNVGAIVARSEIAFTVNAQYTAGSEFEFYTYPSFGTVVLSEMSLPVILEADVALSIY